MEVMKEFIKEDFKEMEELEREFYEDDHITPHEEVYRWFQKYPYIVSSVKECDKIIGFVNIFPIKKKVLEKIQSGEFNDKDMTVDDIVDISMVTNERIYMYLCCVVIKKEYRKSDALKLLIKETCKVYKNFEGNIECIVTDNVTLEGERFSKKLGLKKVVDTVFNSKIYIGKYEKLKKF